MVPENIRDILDDGVEAVVTLNVATNEPLREYLAAYSSWEPGSHVYLETPLKFWEGIVVYGDSSGVILEKVVSVFQTGETGAHYRTGAAESEALPPEQCIALSSRAIMLCARLDR